ncbi:hypothetical protein A0H81_10276 [Grifola frondosa]|uniref:Uncharacterized protein n=1 Tax=Grifola frondosa TaxID=5627 RepID=A0A1C7M066_GRIFR|nr:hypothetical protein A0H81_10276 [Grifola frondosa]
MTGALCYGSGDLSDDDDRKGLSPTRRSGSAERHIHHVNSRQTMESFGSASVARSASGGALSRFWNHKAGRLVYSWYLLLRHAHLTAAREQAVERVERINQAYGREGAEAQQHRERPVVGGDWEALGSDGIRREATRGTQRRNLMRWRWTSSRRSWRMMLLYRSLGMARHERADDIQGI